MKSYKSDSSENAFIEDKDYLVISREYFIDLLSSNQNNQDEFKTTSVKNSLNSQSQNVDLSSAHKYLGYATALFAGITAATFSFDDFHKIAGYTTAGLSLIYTDHVGASGHIGGIWPVRHRFAPGGGMPGNHVSPVAGECRDVACEPVAIQPDDITESFATRAVEPTVRMHMTPGS